MLRNGRLTDTQLKILRKMEEHKDALTPKQIANLTGIPHQTVKQAMRALRLTKYVVQVDVPRSLSPGHQKGGYKLAKNCE